MIGAPAVDCGDETRCAGARTAPDGDVSKHERGTNKTKECGGVSSRRARWARSRRSGIEEEEGNRRPEGSV
jgi:hypothetical protein